MFQTPSINTLSVRVGGIRKIFTNARSRLEIEFRFESSFHDYLGLELVCLLLNGGRLPKVLGYVFLGFVWDKGLWCFCDLI